mmetsp:Transcript_10800/g.28712  ORF Transcript_10800/g.28712 Transcript_10800/m.28712 type:complete len:273 (+) Transcript_10800:1362-2180(+)
MIVQPLATHSSAFMVVDNSLPPNAFEHISLTQGTREDPPHTSTTSMPDTATPQLLMAPASTAATLSIIGWHISKKSNRSILLEKSSSSMRHSQVMLDSEFADRIFLVLVTASSSLKSAFLLDNTSQPVFFLNCSAKTRIKHSSMSRPPTLADFSHKTVILPLTNLQMATEKIVWPIMQKATVCGFSTSKEFDRQYPYSSAIAECSFINLSTLRPAIFAASSKATRWKCEKWLGTPITASSTTMLVHASVMSFSLVKNIAVTAVVENSLGSPL